MVRITAAARLHLQELERHFLDLERDLAAERLAEAVVMAGSRIDRQSGPFFSTPRPYPSLRDLGWQWLKVHRYWFGFAEDRGGYAITAIHYDTADIPTRIERRTEGNDA